MSLIGLHIRDLSDGEEGYILRPYGDSVYSALMDNREIRYFQRRPGVVEVVKSTQTDSTP